MANSLNKVQLIGNMTADPEIKETPNGQKVASFSIATNRKWKDAAGVVQEDTEFHNIVAWRGLSEIIESYTSKGKKLFIEGHLKTRSWEDTAGVKRYKTEIIADQIILLSGGEKKQNNPEYEEEPEEQKPKNRQEPAKKTRPKIEEDISIEDIPF